MRKPWFSHMFFVVLFNKCLSFYYINYDEKYCNAVPLERQAKDLAAKGVKIPTATLANWVIYAANVFLKPIM